MQEVPESVGKALIPDVAELPGYVYAVGKSVRDKVAIYRLENKLIEGTGLLSFKNIEGLARAPKGVKDSINAAFNYFKENYREVVRGKYDDFDYTLYFNDLQDRGVCDEISVAEVVGLFSALSDRPVIPGLAIFGRVVMSGSMIPVATDLEDVFVAVSNAGGRVLLLPDDCMKKCKSVKNELKMGISIRFYSTPVNAARQALGLE